MADKESRGGEGVSHLLMLCSLHTLTSENAKREVSRHNPIDCTAVKLNVFYLNKLWMGLAKPGMTLYKESKLITEYGSM